MNLDISSAVMAMFSDYESRPITRKAILIDDSMLITKINGESTWELKKGDASLFFKAYVQPVVGDYIVHLKDDVYHVDAVTFAERNIIPADIELATGSQAILASNENLIELGIKYATETAKGNATKLLWQLEGYMLARHIEAQGPITTMEHE